jgi:hypothetical protein
VTDHTAEPPQNVAIDVRRGTPTEDELAALMAVVAEAYSGEAAEAVADDEPARSAWAISSRNLREPLRRDLGWRG